MKDNCFQVEISCSAKVKSLEVLDMTTNCYCLQSCGRRFMRCFRNAGSSGRNHHAKIFGAPSIGPSNRASPLKLRAELASRAGERRQFPVVETVANSLRVGLPWLNVELCLLARRFARRARLR
jgi:hypothetical protein